MNIFLTTSAMIRLTLCGGLKPYIRFGCALVASLVPFVF